MPAEAAYAAQYTNVRARSPNVGSGTGGWSLAGPGLACFLTDGVVIRGLLSYVFSSGRPEGTMMSFPLTLRPLLERAAKLFPNVEIVSIKANWVIEYEPYQ
jgi:hypothetical protein